MSYNDNGKNSMVDGLAAVITHVSLHTGNPGTTGANEVTGGSPAYARQPVTWAAAAGGQRANDATETFDVPASSEVFFLGYWDALTVGNFYGYAPLGTSLVGVATAQSSDDIIRSDGHGLVNNDRIVVANVFAESLPTGLTEGVVYFVISGTTDTFQLSLTQGGAAIDLTTDGELAFQRIIPESFGAQGQLQFGIGDIVLDATAM